MKIRREFLVCLVFGFLSITVKGSDLPKEQIQDLTTWLTSSDTAETTPAGMRLREVLQTKGAEGENLATHLLDLAEKGDRLKRNLYDLLSSRAFTIGNDREIIPHLNGAYLKRLAQLSIPDDANRRCFSEYEAAVAYLKLNPDDHELYWRLRLAATRDAKISLLPAWSIREEMKNRENIISEFSKEFPRPVRHFGLAGAWDILTQLNILKPGMPLADAEKILGEPTEKTPEYIQWYYDSPRHVNPCFTAELKDGRIVRFRSTKR